MKHLSTRYAVLAGAISLALVLAGCASPASRVAMTPQTASVGKQHPHSIHVEASGGAETGAMDSSNISDADLKASIEDAIIQSKLFKSIVQGSGGDYELSVRVISLSKPLFGGSFTVEMETAWSLTKAVDPKAADPKAANHSVVLRNSVKSSGTATMGDSLVGVTRLRLAVERAARENISQGMKAIAELNL